MKSRHWLGISMGVLYVGLALVEGNASARPMWVKQAKEMGLPAENCLYCHTEKLPKKDTFKPEQLNERGAWLFAEKTKRKAKDPEVAWLKDYPGPKEQK